MIEELIIWLAIGIGIGAAYRIWTALTGKELRWVRKRKAKR